MWGVWSDGRLYFKSESLVEEGIKSDARIQVNLESGDEVVIVEGIVSEPKDYELGAWVVGFKQKYNLDVPGKVESVCVLTPHRVLAWISDSSGNDGGALFANTATEWRF